MVVIEQPTIEAIIEHNHIKIRLLFCIYDASTKYYIIKTYYYCNTCGIKMDESSTTINDIIPDMNYDNMITKVICNVKSNGREYEWFGHQEDRAFYIQNADKW